MILEELITRTPPGQIPAGRKHLVKIAIVGSLCYELARKKSRQIRNLLFFARDTDIPLSASSAKQSDDLLGSCGFAIIA